MKQKITITVNGSRFEIDVDPEFGKFLQSQIAKDFNPEGNNDFKALLHAYVRKCHLLYESEKEIDSLLKKL